MVDKIVELRPHKSGDPVENDPEILQALIVEQRAEIEKLRRDAGLLLASLDFMAEATGESPDPEDAALIEQIRADLASLERTQEEKYPKKPGPGKGPASFTANHVRDEGRRRP